jgi:hypothetical protein
MVGVSNPIMRRDRRAGWRFVAGFGVGLVVAAGLLAGPLLLVSAAVRPVPQPVRAVVLLVLVALLAIADLLNRTPHVWRQVPQRLARDLDHQPGRLGLIWAIDLGLLVTTQKTTSLLWIALAGAVLLGTPATIGLTLAVIAAGYWLATTVLVVTGDAFITEPYRLRRFGGWAGTVRRVAGAATLGVAAAASVVTVL